MYDEVFFIYIFIRNVQCLYIVHTDKKLVILSVCKKMTPKAHLLQLPVYDIWHGIVSRYER